MQDKTNYKVRITYNRTYSYEELQREGFLDKREENVEIKGENDMVFLPIGSYPFKQDRLKAENYVDSCGQIHRPPQKSGNKNNSIPSQSNSSDNDIDKILDTACIVISVAIMIIGISIVFFSILH